MLIAKQLLEQAKVLKMDSQTVNRKFLELMSEECDDPFDVAARIV